MKRTIQKWSELYFETFRDTRLLTQIVSFAVAVMIIVVLGDSIYVLLKQYWTLPHDEFSPESLKSFFKEFIIALFIATLFGSRFLLLFSKRKYLFWFSQTVYLMALLTLWAQAASLEHGGCTKNVFPFFGEFLSYVFVSYLFFSPLRQVLTLLASLIKLFSKADA